MHVHAFPDAIAAHAIRTLEAETDDVKACHGGTVKDLLASMDAAGIDHAVLCSIATRPGQFQSILDWSASLNQPRLTALPSVHPADPEAVARVHTIADRGFIGLKIHPYYQDFTLDDEELFPLYQAARERGLLVVCHTGFDIAFPRIRRGDPVRIRRVHETFPGLLFIATHLGAWDDWDEVERHLIGHPIYMETSFSTNCMPPARARRLLTAHPAEYLLFGTDSPWTDQAQALRELRALDLPEDRLDAILWKNAHRLLHARPRTPLAR